MLHFHRVSFEDLPGWQDDDHGAAFEAFLQSAQHHLLKKPYGAKALARDLDVFDVDAFTQICRHALTLAKNGLNSGKAQRFFEENFDPYCVSSSKEPQKGFVTGYYQPQTYVSFAPDSAFPYPLYRQPADLVALSDKAVRSKTVPDGCQYARKSGEELTLYPDRQAIDQGYLNGQGLEIAYCQSKADAYFIHIQGSAKLVDQAGQTKHIGFAAKNGHPYASIGKILVEQGDIPQDRISMASILAWMAANPDKVDALLWHNKSYIFFKVIEGLAPDLGPVGASKVQLTSGRSLAVDKSIYPFGLPVYVAADNLDIGAQKPHFQCLMMMQDTGSAIIGCNRGDIFVGSGDLAGQIAGNIKHEANFYVFLPKSAGDS